MEIKEKTQVLVDAPCCHNKLDAERVRKALQTILASGITVEEIEVLAGAGKEKIDMAVSMLRMGRGLSNLKNLVSK